MKLINTAVFLFTLILSACASRATVKRTLNTALQQNVVRSGIMLKRMGDKPTLTALSNKRFIVKSPLAEITLTGRGKKTEISLTSSSQEKAETLLSFLDQTSPPALLLKGETAAERSLIGLFGLHLIAPSLSAVYSGYKNPFAGKKNVWVRFLIHLGIDALGTTAAATRGYSRGFQLNTGTVAFLLLHRLATLPSLIIETDLYNRSMKAGYRLRF